jgi:hypothetical protein
MVNYFKDRLAQVKKAVGAKCTYLAFSQEKDTYFFLVNLLNDSGAKDKVKIEIKGIPQQLEDKDYLELIEILKTRSYVSS